jgi:Zn-dependent protease
MKYLWHKNIPPIRLHFSFVLIFFVYALYIAATSNLNIFLNTCILFAILFVSVLLHELGHSFKAFELGYETAHITLYPFGGVAAIGRSSSTGMMMQDNPSHELKIALAGPLTNLLICVLASPLAYFFDVPLMFELMILNLAMGVFNLLPAFPMDGGRVLRASISMRFNHNIATKVSLATSLIASTLFVFVGFMYGLTMLAVVGIILLLTIRQEFARLSKGKPTARLPTKYFSFI